MQIAGSRPNSPSTAIFAMIPLTASGHPGNLGEIIHAPGHDLFGDAAPLGGRGRPFRARAAISPLRQ